MIAQISQWRSNQFLSPTAIGDDSIAEVGLHASKIVGLFAFPNSRNNAHS
jgi:hypothetical protein